MAVATGLDEARFDELGQWFRGELLRPGDLGYDQGRQLWNAMFDKRPEVVAMCTGAADVIDAVNFAREQGLRVAVRGGGHSVAGLGSLDGGMMINLSRMDGVHVDRKAGTVRVEGGATWGDVDRETQAFGLVAPGGIVSDTGVAGLTLGGGLGWVRGKYGLSCDNLLSAEVVTAEGELLTASATENADLYWGLRGGGGNFGIVTSFEFGLHPLGPTVMVALPIYPLEEAPSILRGWRDFMRSAPDEVTSHAGIWTFPGEPPGLPPEAVGRDVIFTAAVYAGAVEEGERVLGPLRELGAPIVDISSPMPFRALQSSFDPFFGVKGTVRAYWKSLYLTELSDAAIDVIARRALARPTPWTSFNIPFFGGAVTRVGAQETAFGPRWPFMVSIDANSVDDTVSDEELKRWTREFWAELQQFSAEGAYLNFVGEEEQGMEEIVKLAYGANYERLRELKRKYDPHNFFRINQNVAP
ncbi:MAG: FAD-binding oxidoreductase [Dehalococcoidia bacterium]